jgi:hypothetical protein
MAVMPYSTVPLQQSRGTNASVVITVSYFADKTNHTASQKLLKRMA